MTAARASALLRRFAGAVELMNILSRDRPSDGDGHRAWAPVRSPDPRGRATDAHHPIGVLRAVPWDQPRSPAASPRRNDLAAAGAPPPAAGAAPALAQQGMTAPVVAVDEARGRRPASVAPTPIDAGRTVEAAPCAALPGSRRLPQYG